MLSRGDKSRSTPFRPPGMHLFHWSSTAVRDVGHRQRNSSPISLPTSFATKSTTYSPSSRSFYVNNLNFSSTCTCWLHCRSSSLYSRLVSPPRTFPPPLSIALICCLQGFIIMYVSPLAFVLCVTMGKEAYDDYKRNLRDHEANSQKYLTLVPPSPHKRIHLRSSESTTLFDVAEPELQAHSQPDPRSHTR